MEPIAINNISSACDMNLNINFVTTLSCLGHNIVTILQQLYTLFTNLPVSSSQVMFSNLSKFSWFFIDLIFAS